MKTWVVEYADELYGPFLSLQAASLFCDAFQARSSIKIRTLSPPTGQAQSDVINNACQSQAMLSQDDSPPR